MHDTDVPPRFSGQRSLRSVGWRAFLALLSLICAAPAALARQADPVSVAAAVEPRMAYLGDSVTLQISVNGSRNPEQPELPALPGFDVTPLGGQDVSRSSVIIINGRRSEDSFKGYVFQYRLTPTAKGVQTIPSIRVVVNGKAYETDPVQVNVVEAGSTEGFKLKLSAEKERVYVGEPVRVRLVWYVSQEVQRFKFSLAGGGAGEFDLLALPDPRPAGTRDGDDRFVTLEFQGEQAVGRRGQAELNGQTYVTVTLERILVPHKPGSVQVGPGRVAFNAVVGRRQRSIFDSPFDDPAQTERRVVSSEPLTLEVEPLPQPAPPGFMGLIGEFRVEASAQPTEVNVGDPITLTVRVLGPEPLERVPALALAQQPGLAASFKLPGEPTLPTVQPGAAVFTQTIRATSDRVKEIPPIELPYFDVGTGKYGVARSGAIPITVRPTTEVTLEGQSDKQNDAQSAAQERPGGIAPLMTDAAALRDAGFNLLATVRRPAVAAVLVGPPALYVLAAAGTFLHRRSQRDPLARRRRRALVRAKGRLRSAGRKRTDGPGVAGAVSAVVRGYIADSFGAPEAGMTTMQAVALLREHEVGGADEADGLLRRCDAQLFAGAPGSDPGPLAEEARTLLDRLAGEMGGRA